MPASVKGGIALRKSLRKFSPDLAKALPKEIAAALKPITKSARGYLPDNSSVLSGWLARENSQARFPTYDAKIARAGIGYKTTPSKPNRSGFRSLARIVNASPSGSIYETAGRLNPQGRPQAPLSKVVAPGHVNFGKTIRSGSKGQSLSNNPHAGQQFIEALDRTGTIVNAFKRAEGASGRATTRC